MDDQGACGPRFCEECVHAVRHFTAPQRGIFTGVRIPHVADDEGRLRREPCFVFDLGCPRAGPGAQVEGEHLLRKCVGMRSNSGNEPENEFEGGYAHG